MVFINLGGYAEINVDETKVGIVICFVVKLQVTNSQADHFQLIKLATANDVCQQIVIHKSKTH